MIQAYKILHGIDDINKEDFFIISFQSTHRPNEKLYKTLSRFDLRKYFFSQWVFQDWNDLPQSAVEAPNILAFKKDLKISGRGPSSNIKEP